MRKNWIILVGLVAMAGVGCHKSSTTDDSSASASPAGAAFGTVNANINKLATPPGGVVANSVDLSHTVMARSVQAFGNVSDWSGSSLLPDPRNSGGTCSHTAAVSPKTFMGIEFTENAVRCNNSDVNVFGRLRSALSTACVLAHAFPYASSADIPTSGTTTLAISASVASLVSADCGTDLPSGMSSITLTFSVPSSTADFDRLITATDGANVNTSFYITYNSTKVAVARNESNSNGANRAIVIYDRTNNILKAEYISGPSNTTQANGDNVYLHRLYYDGSADLGRVVTSIEQDSTAGQGAGAAVDGITTKFVVTAKPQHTSTQDFAMGLDFYGSGWGTYTSSGASYNLSACVASADGSLTNSNPTITSNQFTCGAVTGIAPAGFTADATIWTFVHSHLTNWWSFVAVPSISWDMSTIHTAGATL